MYYSRLQQPPALFEPGSQPALGSASPSKKHHGRFWLGAALLAAAAVTSLLLAVVWQPGDRSTTGQSPVKPTESAATPTPKVAGVSFGDILNKKLTFNGWLAGVKDGNIVILHPESGSVTELTTVEHRWHGPISSLVWSPDRTKLAYLVIPRGIVAEVAKDPNGYSRQHSLGSVVNPNSFPFGQLMIIDVATKQIQETHIELRNVHRSFIWLDDQHIATVAQKLSIFNLSTQTAESLTAAGSTNPDELLQAPLAWQSAGQTLYFTKVRRGPNQSVRLLLSLKRDTNQVTELAALKTGTFEEVSSIASSDIAIADDGERLAVVGQEGLYYRTLDDGGIHPLPYNEKWLWLRSSSISDLIWLSPSRLGFTATLVDGATVWGVWNIPDSTIATFGRDAKDGSWDLASGRLALIQPDGLHLGFLTPNWQDPAGSVLKTEPIAWDAVSW